MREDVIKREEMRKQKNQLGNETAGGIRTKFFTIGRATYFARGMHGEKRKGNNPNYFYDGRIAIITFF